MAEVSKREFPHLSTFPPALTLLAMGSEGKGSFAWVKEGKVYQSRDFEDLRNPTHFSLYRREIHRILEEIRPRIILVDLHPLYLSTQLGEEISRRFIIPLEKVQHHKAHISAGMIEKGWSECLGISLDGTGLGEDGRIWGSEIFMVREKKFHRLSHIRYISLPGGDRVVEEVWRVGLSLLKESFGEDVYQHFPSFWRKLDKKKGDMVLKMLDKKFHSPQSSGMGRLFDGVSSLLGIKWEVTGPAEAAVELEKLASSWKGEASPYTLHKEDGVLDWRIWIGEMEEDLKKGKDISFISFRFHLSVVEWVVREVEERGEEEGVRKVVLSGGCFLNRILRDRILERLEQKGFDVVIPSPPHDYSISVGQVYWYHLNRTSSIL